MGNLGLAFSDKHVLHDTGPGHPESPRRLDAVVAGLESSGLWDDVVHLPERRAASSDVELVHEPGYLRRLAAACRAGETPFDSGDTAIGVGSLGAALLAAGNTLEALEFVLSGGGRAAFAAVRPPGHHAERARAMGFCLINNVAVAARVAQRRFGLSRILIVDWDVHHGNGTQECFYRDPGVLYASIHQFPHYPMTGLEAQRGAGAGAGTTLNIPLPPGSDDGCYEAVFREQVMPEGRRFGPELIILSAGFDAHREDPYGGMTLTESGFRRLTELLCELGRETGARGLVSVLEGGYTRAALAASVVGHLEALKGA